MHIRQLLMLSAVAVLAMPTASFAQQGDDASAETLPDSIVVTGSRIKRATNEVSSVPITSVEANDLLRGSGVSLGDTLNNLPQLRSTFSLGNSSRFIGTAGVNFLDLRGLGTVRTLVLINGRRQVGSSQGSSEVDVNTISQALLERVEVVTGGASAVYGSDAISGVVNFITKKDFEGLRLNAQLGTSTDDGADQAGASAAFGYNFNDAKGNIAASIEYDYRQRLNFDQRDFSRNEDGFSNNPANIETANDSVPDAIFVRNRRSIIFSDGGTICQSGNCRTGGIFRFRGDGSLGLADLGTRDLRLRTNGVATGPRTTLGGDGTNFNRTGELLPQTRRYAANVLFNYEFSPAVKFAAEGKFVRTDSSTFSSPAFNGLGNQIAVTLDNPFLTPQALATINANGLADADGLVLLQRNNVDFGARGEDNQRDLYRFSGAFSGELSDHVNYELAYTYSRASLKLASLNNRVEQRFTNAVDAVRDINGVLGTRGAIVCRSTLDAGRRTTGNFDVDNCVPVNIFGDGQPSSAAVNFINTTSPTRNTLQQHVVTGFVSADSGGFFRLPGGPVGLVAGFEYRTDSSNFDVPDSLNGVPGDTTGINLLSDGLTFLNALLPERGRVSVIEGFAEVNVPLLRDVPFAKELSFDAAFRYAKYNNAQVGGVYSFKVGGQYAPVDDLRFRVNYSRAVRAPGVTELFGPDVQNFFSVSDPCDINDIGSGSATRAANCAALGLPVGFISDLAATPTGTSGGNPNLQEEVSKSFTAGVLFKPRFLKNFSFSADYYQIKIDQAIASVAAQDILDQCVDAATIDNAFCPLVDRAGPNTAGIPRFNIAFIRQRSLNFSGLKARGVDFELNYKIGLGSLGTLSLRNLTTYVIQRDDFPFIAEPNRPDQFLRELGDPRFLSNLNVNFQKGNFHLNYELRYVGNQLLVDAEDVLTVGGRPPENPDAQDQLKTGIVTYHSARVSYDLNKGTDVFIAVDNIGNRKPPFGLLGTDGPSGIYDNIGRYISVGFTARF